MAVHNECELGMEIRDAPPAHLLLKIESFSKLSDHGIENHKSREFLAGTYKWRLVIHPQSNDVSVFLSVAETEFLPEGWEVKADCFIFLHNQISDNYFCFRSKARSFDAKNLKWGVSLSNRMLAELFNGFLVDDNCTFGAEVFVSEPRVSDSLSLLDWKISNFSKLDDVWVSEVFRAGGFQWKLKLHPNGFGVSEEKSISILLECVDCWGFRPDENVEASFEVRIKSKLPHAHFSKHAASHTFTRENFDWKFLDFISIADMHDPRRGFTIDDCCFLEAQISMLDRC